MKTFILVLIILFPTLLCAQNFRAGKPTITEIDSIVHWDWTPSTSYLYSATEYGFHYENDHLTEKFIKTNDKLFKYNYLINEVGDSLQASKEEMDSTGWTLIENRTWQYDSLGKLINTINLRDKLTYGLQNQMGYDSSGRLSHKLYMQYHIPKWDTLKEQFYIYNSQGNKIKTISKIYWNNGYDYDTVWHTYNADGMLLCTLGNNSSKCYTYTGNLKTRYLYEFEDGYGLYRIGLDEHYSYDNAQRLTDIGSFSWGYGSWQTHYYYDSVGNIIYKIEDNSGKWMYSYKSSMLYDHYRNMIQKLMEDKDFDEDEWKFYMKATAVYDLNNILVSRSRKYSNWGDSLYSYYNSGTTIENIQTFPDFTNTTATDGKILVKASSSFEPLIYVVDFDTVDIVNDTISGLRAGNHRLVIANSQGRIVVKGFHIPVDSLREEENETEIVQIYPVPANDKLIIEYRNDISISDGSIEIISLTGSVLRIIPLSSRRMEIELNGISSGIYFLKIITGESVLEKKFLKQ